MMLVPVEVDENGRVKIEPTGEKCTGCGRPLTNVSEYRYIEGDPTGRKWCKLCGPEVEVAEWSAEVARPRSS